jgi:hypothetical protein
MKKAFQLLQLFLEKLQKLKNIMKKDTKLYLKMLKKIKYLLKIKYINGNALTADTFMKVLQLLNHVLHVHILNLTLSYFQITFNSSAKKNSRWNHFPPAIFILIFLFKIIWHINSCHFHKIQCITSFRNSPFKFIVEIYFIIIIVFSKVIVFNIS